MARFIIDRIEEGRAVLECDDGTFTSIEAAALPKEAKQHDCLELTDGHWTVDGERTEKRKIEARQLFDELFKKSNAQ